VRSIFVALGFALLLSLSGCGGSSTPTATEAKPPAPVAPPPADKPPAADSIKLN